MKSKWESTGNAEETVGVTLGGRKEISKNKKQGRGNALHLKNVNNGPDSDGAYQRKKENKTM